MKNIPINEDEVSSLNKKAIKLIVLLIILGTITGLILSSIFISEANDRISRMDDYIIPFPPDAEYENELLTFSDIFLPSIGVIIVCISAYLLLGLIFVYIKIFLKSSSKYIVGLLFFLTPLFVQSIYSVNTLRSLFVSEAIPYFHIRESIGFGVGGLGGILVMLSVFEIVGLTILLYLSNE